MNRLARLGAVLLFAQTWPAAATPLDTLVQAYPDTLAGHEGDFLLWRDGTRMAASDGSPDKPLAVALHHASILDQMRLPYPRGPLTGPPAPDDDPGRIRDRAFFDHMYGDCTRGEVEPHLLPVVWLPAHWGHVLRATSINGVATRLASISRELDALPDGIRRFAYPSAGTYVCRHVADTGEPSMHAYGAAIDINVAHSDYWLWRAHARGTVAPYINHIPAEIVAIFERHGFIWGGKWSHFDTMHFEYRPELLN